MGFKIALTLFVFVFLLTGSLQKEDHKKEGHAKKRTSKTHHYTGLRDLLKNGVQSGQNSFEGSTQNSLSSTDTTQSPGSDTGPVLFPGEPSPEDTTTPRVFLYNTTTPTYDDQPDEKRTIEKAKIQHRSKKHHKERKGSNKKGKNSN